MTSTGGDAATAAAGRSCPLHYRYPPAGFARAAEAHCDVLYVVGGLYGNEPALDAVLELFDRERGDKRLIFNGDFHWFDTDPATFRRVTQRVLAHDALRGNVETELADPQADADGADAGCGCAYPAWVGDAVVERSNRILQQLRATAGTCPDLLPRLAALPMHRRIDVGGLRMAVVHGDAESLAGWGFAQEHLRDPAHRQTVQGWFEAAQVDAFACSHTCLPVFCELNSSAGAPVWVLNNGAAGMPNFKADHAGVVTRIAVHPFVGAQRRFGIERRGVYMDAIALDIDIARWHTQFLRQWPAGSDAHASYWERLAQGPDYTPGEAVMRRAG